MLFRHILSPLLFLIASYFLLIIFLLLPTNIQLVQHLAFQIDRPWLSNGQIAMATAEAWRQVVFGQPSPNLSAFTPAENAHLQDVHRVLSVFLAVSGIVTLIAILCMVKNKMSSKSIKKITNKNVFIWPLLFCILSLIFVLIFPTFFDLFHRLFFPQGNYEFPAGSVIIQIFPPTFWLLEFTFLQLGVFLSLLLRAIVTVKFDN